MSIMTHRLWGSQFVQVLAALEARLELAGAIGARWLA